MTDFSMLGMGSSILSCRAALACVVAASMVALVADPAAARHLRARHHKHHKHVHVSKKEKEKIELPKGTLQIVVSIGDQRLTLYNDGVPFAHSRVSTGKPGHPTPMGVFTVISKARYHRSNLYSSAPMPFMQRITWSGVALHSGYVPAYPASHGCIRMPDAFARKLWRYTKVGVRVIVARQDVPPQDISHPKLFVPKPQPVVELPVPAAKKSSAAAPQPAPAVMTAQSIDPTKATDAPGPVSDSAAKDINKALRPTVSGIDSKEPGALTLHDTGRSSQPPTPSAPATAATPATTTEPATTSAPAAAATTATAPATGKPKAPYIGLSPADLAEFKPPEPKIPKGPVSVFVSRKTGKLYVRKGHVPMLAIPIVIRDRDKPFGTHVFTAMELTNDGAGMRWTVQTMPAEPPRHVKHRRSSRKSRRHHRQDEPVKVAAIEPPPPSAVLDRIEMPPYAVDKISQWLSPGSSLIVSDHRISEETDKDTDFIVEVR
jgi:L,D-transpeptidase catalytic domain